MAHYAKVNSQGIVEQVIVAEQDVIDSGLFGNPTGWVQTSYNTHGGVHANGGTPLRKNYAGIGYTYLNVRGSNSERINVTINGIPYNDAESHGTFWVNLGDFA